MAGPRLKSSRLAVAEEWRRSSGRPLGTLRSVLVPFGAFVVLSDDAMAGGSKDGTPSGTCDELSTFSSMVKCSVRGDACEWTATNLRTVQVEVNLRR